MHNRKGHTIAILMSEPSLETQATKFTLILCLLQVWGAAEQLELLKQKKCPRFQMAKLRGIAAHLCVVLLLPLVGIEWVLSAHAPGHTHPMRLPICKFSAAVISQGSIHKGRNIESLGPCV